MQDYEVKDFIDMEIEQKLDYLWDLFLDLGICSEETLTVVVKINGYNAQTMEDVLYVTTGLRSIEQLCDEFELSPEDYPELFRIDTEE